MRQITPATIQTEAERIVAGQRAAHARHIGGVSWAGLEREVAEVETVEAVAFRLTSDHAKAQAYRLTPGGRFLSAIEALEADGYDAEACQLRTIRAHFYYAGGAMPRDGEPVQVDGVGKALRILAPMDCRPAQDAELALADLLIEAAPLMMVAA